MPKYAKKTIQWGGHALTLETGRIARQASGAVLVTYGDTVILVTAVGVREAKPRDFFPLTVQYVEKSSAAGKIPGGYFKREGRPTERETLISRLVDRPIRPLFPKGFLNEVQVIATVLSMDLKTDTDIVTIIGAAAALSLSGMPFKGPVAAARVGYREGAYVLNPGLDTAQDSDLNLVVAGTKEAVLMVESEAEGLSEEVMLGAVMFGHEHMQPVIEMINALVEEAGVESWGWEAPVPDTALEQAVEAAAAEGVAEAYLVADKIERKKRLSDVHQRTIEQLCDAESEEGFDAEKVGDAVAKLEKTIVRRRILAKEARIDGRDHKTVRPIATETNILPRTHGSALFTRGETQAIVSVTLGTERDSQIIDDLTGESKETFLLHYNFPPYSVGEARMMTGPKRREIGHGRLAKRGVQSVMPTMEDFPYVVRVVSEITESNGSSSMATVCGASMALMDAGVPIANPVSGIAMGLVLGDDGSYVVLTDILGDEDHLGDMDFKVAGTAGGITALQMDIKVNGITHEIMETALAQAKDARLHILGEMAKGIERPSEELSAHAPRYTIIKINPDKIRDVIGKGGAVIRDITEQTGVNIDISDDGTVKIASVDQESADAARARIDEITAEAEVGRVYDGPIVKIMDFGAFVKIMPQQDGFLHISQICDERIDDINSKLSEGQEVRVKVVEIDRQGRVRVTMKDVEQVA